MVGQHKKVNKNNCTRSLGRSRLSDQTPGSTLMHPMRNIFWDIKQKMPTKVSTDLSGESMLTIIILINLRSASLVPESSLRPFPI